MRDVRIRIVDDVSELFTDLSKWLDYLGGANKYVRQIATEMGVERFEDSFLVDEFVEKFGNVREVSESLRKNAFEIVAGMLLNFASVDCELSEVALVDCRVFHSYCERYGDEIQCMHDILVFILLDKNSVWPTRYFKDIEILGKRYGAIIFIGDKNVVPVEKIEQAFQPPNYEIHRKDIGENSSLIVVLKTKVPSVETHEGSMSLLTTSTTKPFSEGIVDEVVNYIALTRGKQIILCKKRKLGTRYVFLVPKKDTKSNFKMSKNGERLLNEYEIDTRKTRYIAEVEYIENIPYDNQKFWEELYETGEFNLWEIDEGPIKYFLGWDKKKMLCILRVYEMPYELEEGKDFKRQRVPKMISETVRTRIEKDFENGNSDRFLVIQNSKREGERLLR